MTKKPSNREIEERYASAVFRLTQERNDFVLPQILDFVRKRNWINLRPEYQRRLVWDVKKRSLFIESLLMNIPIPPIFLFEWEYGRYEVMDGQQRLNAIVDFYDNRFALKGLSEWPELNGRRYGDCPPVIRRGLDRRRISAVVILAENLAIESEGFDIRKTVFERLNTGGQNLNPQELRNCLYSGVFNNLLIDLAGHPLFNDLLGMPRYRDHITDEHISKKLSTNSYFRRMRDVEIVLRFFALRKRSNIRGAMRKILDRCMQMHTEIDANKEKELRDLFVSRLELCERMFGDRAFRLDAQNKYAFSVPLFDAEMVAADRLYEKKDQLISKGGAVLRALDRALADEETYELIVGRPNTASAIRDRLNEVERLFQAEL